MRGKKVEYLAEATEELLEALDWYLQLSMQAAQAFLTEVDRSIQLIQETPRMWPYFEGNTRRCVLRKFPYGIVFRETCGGIEVVAVAHERRRPRYWADR